MQTNTNGKSWDDKFLSLAEHIASWSKDPSTKVGAVIVDSQNRVVSLGYNGFPQNIEDDERLYDRETKYQLIVHAEQNAILFAKRDLSNCTLYTWPMMPCCRCASIVIQAGITRVVSIYNDSERWQDSFRLTEKMFREAGVKLEIAVYNT